MEGAHYLKAKAKRQCRGTGKAVSKGLCGLFMVTIEKGLRHAFLMCVLLLPGAEGIGAVKEGPITGAQIGWS